MPGPLFGSKMKTKVPNLIIGERLQLPAFSTKLLNRKILKKTYSSKVKPLGMHLMRLEAMSMSIKRKETPMQPFLALLG